MAEQQEPYENNDLLDIENNPESVDNIKEEEEEEESPLDLSTQLAKRERFDHSGFLPIVTSILCGLSFGLLFNKSRVFEPHVIYNQMIFKQFILLKIFLSALGTSCFSAAFVAQYYPDYFTITRSKRAQSDTKNIYRVLLGSIALGAGMSISGSCPGNLPVQIGAGVENSGFTGVGTIIAALLYAFAEKPIDKFMTKPHLKHTFVDEHFTKKPFKTLCISMGIMAWIITIACEIIFPWKSELNKANSPDCNFLTCGAWPPSICGLLVGLIQLPLMLVFGSYIATAYVIIILNLCEKKKDNHPFYRPRVWRYFFFVCIIFGSWIGVALNTDTNQADLNVIQHPYDDIRGMNITRSIIGGVLIIFGARLGKGCTSGHGFSGTMVLSTAALCAICGLFAGAIATAVIFEIVS